MISLPYSLPEEHLSHFFAMYEALRVLIAATTCLCTCEGFFSSACHLISTRAHAGRLQNGEISLPNHGSPYKTDSFALSCHSFLTALWLKRKWNNVQGEGENWCLSNCNLFFFLCSTRLATCKLVIMEHECITSYIVRSDCFVR